MVGSLYGYQCLLGLLQRLDSLSASSSGSAVSFGLLWTIFHSCVRFYIYQQEQQLSRSLWLSDYLVSLFHVGQLLETNCFRCWISEDYDWLRLVVVYAFIWAALLFSLVVYFFAGRVIWRKRAQLDGFLNPWNESPFSGTITTEIEITTESRHGFNDLVAENPASEATSDNSHRQYMINIESATNRKRGIPGINVRTITRDVASHETNAESWLYARAAFLFFITLAITWIPASAFRIYSVANNKAENFGLSYVASFLFPLQGFWNAVVYIITSRTACKEFWNSIRGRNKGSSVGEIVVGKPGQLGKRGKSGSFQTDEEELRPTKVMIYNKEDVRTESTTRLHAQSSHDDSVLALPSSHDVTTRSSVVEAGDTMGLSGYKR